MSLKKTIQFKDRLVKGVSVRGDFKIAVVKTTDVLRSARKRHQLSLLNSVLLGRTLTASMLLASELKGEERLSLKLEGNGPVKMLIAEANRAGEIRGYSKNPSAELDYSQPGISIGDGLGTGLLTVSKTLYNEAEPQKSTIQLHKGDVISDVAHYLAQSEQIPSAILLSVKIDKNGEIMQAGGVMLQRLPDASEDVIGELQDKLMQLDEIAEMLERGIYIDQIMDEVAKPHKVKFLERQPIHFFCRCNRQRFISALSMLSYNDLKELEGENQEMVCHYCNNTISVSKNEIHELVASAQARMN